MEVGHLLANNWYVLLESTGIIGGLLFTAFSLRSETKTRRIANLFIITQNHREIWTELFRRPGLARVMNPVADLRREPVTREEELFIKFQVLHLSSAYHAMKDDVFVKPDSLRRDIHRFFSLPIPAAVWDKIKSMQDDEFVRYVEACRNWKWIRDPCQPYLFNGQREATHFSTNTAVRWRTLPFQRDTSRTPRQHTW